MFRLAIKMLFGDTAKYVMLLAGLVFATFLMVQQASVFCGLIRWTTATLKNVGAPIYVVEPKVEQVNELNPLRDTDVALVRSVAEVRWAMPLYSGLQKVRLENGNFQTVQLIGIDAASFAGGPGRLKEGRLEDLRLPNTVIVDQVAIERLSVDKNNPIGIGSTFEIKTFYAFVLDNLKNFGALKAMGTSNARLSAMLWIQSFTVGVIGFGIGLLLTAGFAAGALENDQPPFFMPAVVPLAAFVVIQVICFLAALLGVIRLGLFEPAMVFRA